MVNAEFGLLEAQWSAPGTVSCSNCFCIGNCDLEDEALDHSAQKLDIDAIDDCRRLLPLSLKPANFSGEIVEATLANL